MTISLTDPFTDHGLAAQGKGVFSRFVTDAVDVDGDATLGVLLARLGQTCGNGTEKWDIHEVAAQFCQRGRDAQRAGLAWFAGEDALFAHEPNVPGHGIRAAKPKMCGNLLPGRRGAVGLQPDLDKI